MTALAELEARAVALSGACPDDAVLFILAARVDAQGQHDGSPVIVVTSCQPGEPAHRTLLRLLGEYRQLGARHAPA